MVALAACGLAVRARAVEVRSRDVVLRIERIVSILLSKLIRCVMQFMRVVCFAWLGFGG